MTKALDLTKPVQTRDGRPARIICTDARNHSARPIVALYQKSKEPGSLEYLDYLFPDGRVCLGRDSSTDLVNVPEKLTFWLNVYKDNLFGYSSKEFADKYADSTRLKCMKLEVDPSDTSS